MSLKQIWAVLHGSSIWADFARSEFSSAHLDDSLTPFPSAMGKDMFFKAKTVISAHSRWFHCDGTNKDFFWDVWCGSQPLIQISLPRLPSCSLRSVLQDPLHEAWAHLPTRALECRAMLLQLPLHDGKDLCVWTESSDRIFSLKSAFHCVRQRAVHRPAISKLWSSHFSPRAAILTWHILHRAVAVDVLIQSCGIPLPSRCSCCSTNPQAESMDHLLLSGELTASVWGFFWPLFDDRCRAASSVTILC